MVDRLLQQSKCGVAVALQSGEAREIVSRGGGIGVFRPEHAAANFERLPRKWLGFGVAALGLKDIRQMVLRGKRYGMLGAEGAALGR